ncbi:unnamed protein product [Ostreobium quekettii]|uniref:Uncharacterized protein n=1 Tax=Ostreobium quekettii TaxID=121088 RepID=A0A8S1IQR9_9CHLO|nr:unnamed protein product [Ostreobium quekettii]|eukprot:evm.model.scf_155.5 EVM.evm.TU.scf_155.5   scf_155:71692-78524(-)
MAAKRRAALDGDASRKRMRGAETQGKSFDAGAGKVVLRDWPSTSPEIDHMGVGEWADRFYAILDDLPNGTPQGIGAALRTSKAGLFHLPGSASTQLPRKDVSAGRKGSDAPTAERSAAEAASFWNEGQWKEFLHGLDLGQDRLCSGGKGRPSPTEEKGTGSSCLTWDVRSTTDDTRQLLWSLPGAPSWRPPKVPFPTLPTPQIQQHQLPDVHRSASLDGTPSTFFSGPASTSDWRRPACTPAHPNSSMQMQQPQQHSCPSSNKQTQNNQQQAGANTNTILWVQQPGQQNAQVTPCTARGITGGGSCASLGAVHLATGSNSAATGAEIGGAGGIQCAGWRDPGWVTERLETDSSCSRPVPGGAAQKARVGCPSASNGVPGMRQGTAWNEPAGISDKSLGTYQGFRNGQGQGRASHAATNCRDRNTRNLEGQWKGDVLKSDATASSSEQAETGKVKGAWASRPQNLQQNQPAGPWASAPHCQATSTAPVPWQGAAGDVARGTVNPQSVHLQTKQGRDRCAVVETRWQDSKAAGTLMLKQARMARASARRQAPETQQGSQRGQGCNGLGNACTDGDRVSKNEQMSVSAPNQDLSASSASREAGNQEMCVGLVWQLGQAGRQENVRCPWTGAPNPGHQAPHLDGRLSAGAKGPRNGYMPFRQQHHGSVPRGPGPMVQQQRGGSAAGGPRPMVPQQGGHGHSAQARQAMLGPGVPGGRGVWGAGAVQPMCGRGPEYPGGRQLSDLPTGHGRMGGGQLMKCPLCGASFNRRADDAGNSLCELCQESVMSDF